MSADHAWFLIVDGMRQPHPYLQRAAANGAAMVARPQGHAVRIEVLQ